MTTVVSVDDNRLLGDALAVRLAREPEFSWLGCLSRAATVEDRLLELRPDLILLDIDMPGLDAFRLMERMAERLPGTRILVLTGHSLPPDRDRALALGAWGYLSKGISTPQLLAAMRRVMVNEVVLDEEPAGVSPKAPRARRSQPHIPRPPTES